MDSPDDPGIPMWKVAPHIFNKAAQEATDSAAGLISEEGWQNEFRTQAMGDVAHFQKRMLESQFDNFKADSKLAEIAYYKETIQAGNWDGANAHINTMRFHSPTEKEILRREVLVTKELSPLKTAGFSQDPVKVQEAIDSISAKPGEFANVPADQLDFMQNKLETHLVQLERRAEHREIQRQKAAREQAGGQIFQAYRSSLATGAPIPMSLVPDPDPAKGITVETSENFLNLVGKMNKRDQTSNLAVRQDLLTLRARDNVAFQNRNLLNDAKYLSPEDYLYLEKQQMEDRMKSGDAGHAKEIARMHSDKVDAIHEFTGNKLKPQSRPQDKAEMDSLEYAIDQGIEAWQRNNPGKYPDRETVLGIANLTLGKKTGTFTSASGSEVLTKEPLVIQAAIIKDVKQSGRMGSPEVYAAELQNWKTERKKLVEAWDTNAPGDTPSEQAMFDVYRQLRSDAVRQRLDQQLILMGITNPTESARLQLLITPYASEKARTRVGDRNAQDAQDAALVDEAAAELKGALYSPAPNQSVP